MRPSLNWRSSRVLARPTAGASPILPAGKDSVPKLMQPLRKVPVVRTTDSAATDDPSCRRTPPHRVVPWTEFGFVANFDKSDRCTSLT